MRMIAVSVLFSPYLPPERSFWEPPKKSVKGALPILSKSLLTALGERQPVFEIRFKNSASQYRRFVHFNTLTRNLRYIIPTCLVIIAMGVLILTLGSVVLGAIIMGGAFIFPIVMLVGNTIHSMNYLKHNNAYLEMENEYRFYEEILYVKSGNGKRFVESVISYEHLHAAFETRANFYFYMTKTKAVIIDKSTLNDRQYAEFEAFLFECLPVKIFKNAFGFKKAVKRRK